MSAAKRRGCWGSINNQQRS